MTGEQLRDALADTLSDFCEGFVDPTPVVDAVEDVLRGRESGMATPRDYLFAERIFAGWTAELARLRVALKVVEGDPLQLRDMAREVLARKAAS